MSLHPTFSRSQAAVGRDLVQRWCTLAEGRLAHLTELFESGRWRRYHSEIDFLENIQEARIAVDRWHALLAGDVPVSQTYAPVRKAGHAPAPQQAMPEPTPVLRHVPPRLVAVSESPSPQPAQPEIASPPVSPDWQDMLTPASIAERYPMLRAAM